MKYKNYDLNLINSGFLSMLACPAQLLTVPRRRANWMESRSETGHHTSAIRHFWVTSMLQRLRVW